MGTCLIARRRRRADIDGAHVIIVARTGVHVDELASPSTPPGVAVSTATGSVPLSATDGATHPSPKPSEGAPCSIGNRSVQTGGPNRAFNHTGGQVHRA